MKNASEQDASVHEEMFHSLLRTPHRRVDEIISLHKEQFERDPNFYGKLATYAVHQGNSVIRDVNEVCIAVLFASPYLEHREAAYVMLQSLPPYRVTRVMDYFTGFDEIKKHRSFDPPITDGQFGVTSQKSRYSDNHPDINKRNKVIPNKKGIVRFLDKNLRAKLLANGHLRPSDKEYTVETLRVSHVGLGNRNVRGELRSAIKDYLAYREKDENKVLMEGALLRARKHMQRLYSRTNTVPSEGEGSWIHNLLFRNQVKEDTRLASLKKLMETEDPTDQAVIIFEQKIPPTVALSLIKNITPTILISLIEVMSPQELLGNMGFFTKHGATKNPEIKKLIEDKLHKAKGAKKARVDALKGAFAAKSVEGLDEDLAAIMTEVTDAQLKHHGTIKSRTAILVDKSLSMDKAIELAKELAAGIAQACETSDLMKFFLFNTMPTEIIWNESDGDIGLMSAWDRKLKMCKADGGTDPATVLRAMCASGTQVDQILLITDEGENTEGRFAQHLKNYENQFGYIPTIVIVRVGSEGRGYPWSACDRIEKSCKKIGADVDVLRCGETDRVALPNVLQLLSRKSIFELIQDIMSLSLPSKSKWKNKNLGAVANEVSDRSAKVKERSND